MHNPFWVSIKCPECGAPLRYPEGAYTFRCAYCDSVLRVTSESMNLKYMIPARFGERDIAVLIRKILLGRKAKDLPRIRRMRIVYKPFWYFKGMVYCSKAAGGKTDVSAKTWAHSFEANDAFARMLHTLGIQTEVLTLEPYDSNHKEKEVFLPVTVKEEDAEKKAIFFAERNVFIQDEDMRPATPFAGYGRDILESSAQESKAAYPTGAYGSGKFVKTYVTGEKFFIIYYPVVNVICQYADVFHTYRLDGVNGKLLEELSGKDVVSCDEEKNVPYHINLLSHRCKNCGHDLPARDFDVVYYCESCFRLWLLKRDDYHSLKIKVVDIGDRRGVVFVPFWRFDVTVFSEAADTKLETIKDLAGFIKMGDILLRGEDPARKVRLYVPALVTRNPKSVMNLASRVTLFDKDLPLSGNPDYLFAKVLNVSLLPEEAEEMLEPLLVSIIGRVDQRAVRFYSDMRVDVTARELLWYPFDEKGNYYVDTLGRYSISKKAMDINVYGQ